MSGELSNGFSNRPSNEGSAERPRERLQALGPKSLSDAELIALLLRSGVRGVPVDEISRGLLDHCGGLRGLARAGAAELRSARGLGPSKVASILAALEVGRRLAGHRLRPGSVIRSPADIHRHFYPRLRDTRHERFIALLLDGRHRVVRDVTVSQGTLTASLVHPREVFRPALREAAAALVLVHNHPSGDPRPSREDREVTQRLVRAGELLGVRVLDHVVVAEGGYHSFSECGELPGPGGDDS